jgi:hypothetical protein
MAEVCGMKVVLFTHQYQYHGSEWLDTMWLSVLRGSAQLHADQFFSHFVKIGISALNQNDQAGLRGNREGSFIPCL